MTFPPGILRGCFGSLDVLGYKEIKLPTSSQETTLLKSLLNMNRSWGTPQRQDRKLISGPTPTAKTRLMSYNPGLLLAFVLEIEPLEDIFT